MTTLCPSTHPSPTMTSASMTTLSPMTTSGARRAARLTEMRSSETTVGIGWTELHWHPGLHRLIHGRDKLQGSATLTTLKHVRLSGGQRVEDRAEQCFMTKSVDAVRNVTGILNLLVFRLFIHKSPRPHLVDSKPCNLDLTLLTQDRDGTLQILRVSTSRRLEGSERSVSETPDAYGCVLRLDAMKECLGHGAHRQDGAAQPLHEVHVVDGLVSDTATVLHPCAPPRRLIIILLCPVPPDPRCYHQDTSEPAFIQRVLE